MVGTTGLLQTRWFSRERIIQELRTVATFGQNGFPCPSNEWVDIAWEQ